MIKIVITNPEVREMKGVGKTSGKPYHLRFQTGYAYVVDAQGAVAEIPDKFELMLEDSNPGYARGSYQLQPSSVFVSREGRMEMRPRLAAMPSAAKPA